MKSGLQKIKSDHRDYSFHKTFGSFVSPASLPPDLNVDAGLWCPNQNLPQSFTGIPDIPALPFGCTDYTQTDLCIDEDGKLLDPMLLENVTHANANNGADIRVSLKTAISVFQRTAYFNVQAQAPLDWFDAIRVAMWVSQAEKRSVSIGIPWFGEFENLLSGGIMPIPVFDLKNATWHNAKIAGWKTIGGSPYLIVKSWQGPEYGDNGYCYMSRELCNALLNINGTGAFTLSKVAPGQVQTIDLDVIARIVSYFWLLLSKLTPTVPPTIPPAPTPITPPAPPISPVVTPAPAPAPSVPPTATLTALCTAIRNFEGKPGDRNYRNNNPGNCRYSSEGYLPIYQPVLRDKDNFAVFKDYATGFLYLKNLVREKIHQNPDQTLLAFMEVYAPTSDGNDPVAYAANLGKNIGVDYKTFVMKDLIMV
jgi:hypothetical protein